MRRWAWIGLWAALGGCIDEVPAPDRETDATVDGFARPPDGATSPDAAEADAAAFSDAAASSDAAPPPDAAVACGCPVPRATGERQDVAPLDVVTLDGTPSTSPCDRVARWQWTVVERPPGSTSLPVEQFHDPRRPADGGTPDDEETPQALFFADLAGEYVIELQVVDGRGTPGCAPARVELHARPARGFSFELTWRTPEDPDETDALGTDLDLHLLHSNGEGAWTEAPWDCHATNPSPDWGRPGQPGDDPVLTIDDTDGAGPEVIGLQSPECGARYDVGAHYYRSESTFGDPERDPRQEHASFATVRVYTDGALFYERDARELSRAGQLWWVATVAWCRDEGQAPEVGPRDVVYEQGEWP